MEKLLEKFKQSYGDGQFTYQEAKGFGISRGKFYQLVEAGDFERVQRLMYKDELYLESNGYD